MASSGQAIDQLLLDYNTTRDSVQRTAIEEKLAWVYQDQDAYARAIEFYKKALKGRLYDTLRAQKIRVGMAFCYHELGEPDAEIEIGIFGAEAKGTKGWEHSIKLSFGSIK
ncbi:MAG: hypothetical protein EBU52_22960 [Cytophagia bacterium]|nr:hypothetical protein [Cytophagia bacterium]